MKIIEERLDQLFWLAAVSEWLADLAAGEKVQIDQEVAVAGIKAIQYFSGLAISEICELMNEEVNK